MRILISDYSGHPFQVQLSRELARRGHVVLHTYSAGFQTPKGNLQVTPEDADSFAIKPVANSKPFAKNSFFTRRQQEIEIGHRLAELCTEFRPDVVVSSNAPLDTQAVFQKAALAQGVNFVFWLQDIYSEAIGKVVPSKFPVIGHFVARWYRHLEFRLLRSSHHVVAITDDFVSVIVGEGVDRRRVSVVENWAPIDELPRHPRDNAWARANLPDQGLRIVYSGTLGYKHNPELLMDMARRIGEAHVHVFSEGEVADRIKSQAAAEGLSNFSVHPWVPFSELPQMLSAADLFIVVIEPSAGIYSVPSKVLTYLGIGRPILASVPQENLAARLIVDNKSGYVAPPGQEAQLIEQALKLVADVKLRTELGNNGRQYAMRAFDIRSIADKFESILASL